MNKIVDTRELCSLPREFIGCFIPSNICVKGYALWDLKGDTSAFFALFLDNLATQLTLAAIATSFGIPSDFVWSHFFGGVGLSLFIGNAYYFLQASKVASRTGKMNTCAQPYGINTPGAIAKTFGVLVPTFKALEAAGKDPYEAAEIAWSTACAANFLGGIFELLGAFVAPLMSQNVPLGAVLAPLGGIGITWLGLNPLRGILHNNVTHNPLVGFVPLVLMWSSFFGGVSFGPVPPAAVAGGVGTVLAWVVRIGAMEEAAAGVESAANQVGAHWLEWSNCFQYLGDAFETYGSLILGLACTNFMGTFSCVLSAKKSGDHFSAMESMIVDGLGTMIGALCGSPYGTTVYIGHVAYKKMGAKRGYSLLNGVLYLIIGMFGLQALIQAIVPQEAILAIILIVGFSMGAQVVESVPQRWFPAVLVGIAVPVAEYAVNGLSAQDTHITFLSNGFIFISFFYTFVLMMLTDRWFLAAAGIFASMVPLAFFGLLHAAQLNVLYNSEGTIKGNEAQGSNDGQPGWKNVLTYFVCAVICVGFHLLQRMGKVMEPEPEDFRVLQAMSADESPAKDTTKEHDNASVEVCVAI